MVLCRERPADHRRKPHCSSSRVEGHSTVIEGNPAKCWITFVKHLSVSGGHSWLLHGSYFGTVSVTRTGKRVRLQGMCAADELRRARAGATRSRGQDRLSLTVEHCGVLHTRAKSASTRRNTVRRHPRPSATTAGPASAAWPSKEARPTPPPPARAASSTVESLQSGC